MVEWQFANEPVSENYVEKIGDDLGVKFPKDYISCVAINNGANVVDFIEFQVSDSNFYYYQALDLAIKNAYQKAILIAESLGIPNAPVPIRINEVGTPPTATLDFARKESIAATPIEPGNKQIQASVVMKFLY